jgi:hypothetical protein
LGSNEGEPVYYFWNPLFNLTGLIPWLILLAAFVLFRENRRRQAMWILAPVMVIYLLLIGFLKLTDQLSDVVTIYDGIFETLAIGFAVIWLLAERIGGRNRFLTWLAVLAVFLVFLGTSTVTLTSGFERIIMSISLGISVGIVLIAIPLAAVMCRKHFGSVRFCLWTGFWILIVTLLAMVTFAAIQMRNMSELFEYFTQVLMAILIFSGVLIAGLLPFEILLFANSFWRKRFEKVFGISASPAAAAVEPPAPPISSVE